MSDIKCPYCEHNQEICHDEGFGLNEDETFEQECYSCEKIFVFTTIVDFDFSASKADCLNGGEHKYKATCTYPRRCTKMRCIDCNDERRLTDEEMKLILEAK